MIKNIIERDLINETNCFIINYSAIHYNSS